MTTYSESPTSTAPVTRKRLWFGFSAAAIAWTVAGLLNVFLAWQACMGGEAGSFIFTQTGIRIVLGVITFGLLAVSIVGGMISYRNWRSCSEESDLLSAEARGRKEFMGLVGLIISVSLAVGIVWFAIPIYVLGMCVRYR